MHAVVLGELGSLAVRACVGPPQHGAAGQVCRPLADAGVPDRRRAGAVDERAGTVDGEAAAGAVLGPRVAVASDAEVYLIGRHDFQHRVEGVALPAESADRSGAGPRGAVLVVGHHRDHIGDVGEPGKVIAAVEVTPHRRGGADVDRHGLLVGQRVLQGRHERDQPVGVALAHPLEVDIDTVPALGGSVVGDRGRDGDDVVGRRQQSVQARGVEVAEAVAVVAHEQLRAEPVVVGCVTESLHVRGRLAHAGAVRGDPDPGHGEGRQGVGVAVHHARAHALESEARDGERAGPLGRGPVTGRRECGGREDWQHRQGQGQGQRNSQGRRGCVRRTTGVVHVPTVAPG